MTAPIGRHAILRLSTDQGLEGWGEAPAGITGGGSAMRYYGESPETVRVVAADYLLPAVGGSDPRDIAVIHARMDKAVKGHPYAKAMIDMACYDLAGRAMGVGVSTLLGGAHRRGIELAHSLGIMPIERCLEEARQAVAEGALTIKCKTGLDPVRDVELVRRLRELVGPEIAGIYYTDDLVTGSFGFEDGRVMVPEGPGLGVERCGQGAGSRQSGIWAGASGRSQ